MDRLKEVPLKAKIGLKLYGKVGILVESRPEENRFVLQIPTHPDDPYRTAWLMKYDEEQDGLVLISENREKIEQPKEEDMKFTIVDQ